MGSRVSTVTAFLSLTMLFCSSLLARAETPSSVKSSGTCARWVRMVLPQGKSDGAKPEKDLPPEIDAHSSLRSSETLSDTDFFQAVNCLLKLKGNRANSRIQGATRLDVSTTFGTSTAEVASLYYISYLFYGRWDHASAAVLLDSDGRRNTEESIERAYVAYRDWLEKVKAIGLSEARKRKLDPLRGTGVTWY